ncbi:MAG: alpha/beta hydrolase family esterase [Pseudomonadota bacterium]
MSIAENIDYLKRLPGITRLMTGEGLAGFDGGSGRLHEVRAFGPNPGNLRMFAYLPANLPKRPALVVMLHGCAQTAAAYDHGAGWTSLADRHGFVVLAPQQRRGNNPNLCFNWFAPDDVTRGSGEAASIRQMIEHTAHEHGIDRKRVFVTGLSAGGGMASAMLAAYPEVFAGGAIIAGVPHGAAGNLQDALNVMFKAPHVSTKELGNRVRAASTHKGPWPKISVWHGSADTIVHPANAEHIVNQWLGVHGLRSEPMFEDIVDGHRRQGWWDVNGRTVIESYSIANMAHGVPLASGGEHAGRPGRFMLDAGIPSSHHIAAFWGLTERVHQATLAADAADASPRKLNGNALAQPQNKLLTKASSVNGVINRALSAVGLRKTD